MIVNICSTAGLKSLVNLYQLVVLLTCITFYVDGSRYATLLTCEGQSANITCYPGTRINLIRANFGRFSISICNDQGNAGMQVDCMSTISFRILSDLCEHKHECHVEASTSIFGDACPGSTKYLEVHYQCISEHKKQRLRTKPGHSTTLATPTATATTSSTKLAPFNNNEVKSPSMVNQNAINVNLSSSKESSMYNKSNYPSISAESSLYQSSFSSSSSSPSTQSSSSSSTQSSLSPSIWPDDPSYDISVQSSSSPFLPSPLLPSSKSNSSYDHSSNGSVLCQPVNSRGLFWNWTQPGTVVHQKCPSSSEGWAKWFCEIDPFGLAVWSKPEADLSGCKSKWLLAVENRIREEEPILEIAFELVEGTKHRPLYGGDLSPIIDIIGQIISKVEIGLSDYPEDKQFTFVQETLKIMLDISSNLLDDIHRDAWYDLSPTERTRSAAALITLGLSRSTFGGPAESPVCWIDSSVILQSFVLPMGLILFCNLVFLVIAQCAVCKQISSSFVHKEAKHQDRIKQIRLWARGSLALVFLLGLTWSFGIIYVTFPCLVTAYLFTGSNVFQGFFIFIFSCLINDKVRREYVRVGSRCSWLSWLCCQLCSTFDGEKVASSNPLDRAAFFHHAHQNSSSSPTTHHSSSLIQVTSMTSSTTTAKPSSSGSSAGGGQGIPLSLCPYPDTSFYPESIEPMIGSGSSQLLSSGRKIMTTSEDGTTRIYDHSTDTDLDCEMETRALMEGLSHSDATSGPMRPIIIRGDVSLTRIPGEHLYECIPEESYHSNNLLHSNVLTTSAQFQQGSNYSHHKHSTGEVGRSNNIRDNNKYNTMIGPSNTLDRRSNLQLCSSYHRGSSDELLPAIIRDNTRSPYGTTTMTTSLQQQQKNPNELIASSSLSTSSLTSSSLSTSNLPTTRLNIPVSPRSPHRTLGSNKKSRSNEKRPKTVSAKLKGNQIVSTTGTIDGDSC